MRQYHEEIFLIPNQGKLGCPRTHLSQVTEVPICPTELPTLSPGNVHFGPKELSWANGHLCHVI